VFREFTGQGEWGLKAYRETSDYVIVKGKVTGSFVPTYDTSRGYHYQLFALYSSGIVSIYFNTYQKRPEFESEEKRLEFLKKLNSIELVNIPKDGITKYPGVPISALARDKDLKEFLQFFEWFIAQIS